MVEINKVLELKDKIFKNKLSDSELYFVKQVYFNTFGKRLNSGCGTCIVEAYLELKSLTKSKIENMKNKKFEIKEGEVLSMHGMAESFTNANLTNRGALTVLKLNKGCIKFFTKFPEDWHKLVAKFDLKMSDEQANEIVEEKKTSFENVVLPTVAESEDLKEDVKEIAQVFSNKKNKKGKRN